MPLIRRAIAFLLAAVSVLIILSALGVNVGPLLAGLGVVGIAIGLGAQSLVKDLITGIMIVMDDTIAVGDVVTLGNGSGEVEQISIHALKLRDGNGALHTIPFSSMTSVINATKDFSIANLSIPIGYRENVDRVIGEIERLGRELQSDPKFQHLMLGPLEVGGLDQFADYAMILSAAVKTLPGMQPNLVHEFNRRLKRRFDELGIEMPYRSQAMIVRAGDAPAETREALSEQPGTDRPETDRPETGRPETGRPEPPVKEPPGEKSGPGTASP
jgi:small conductance mechanosensitive channel